MLPVLPRNIKLTRLSVPNESEKRITRINFSVASIRMAVILIFETLLKIGVWFVLKYILEELGHASKGEST